MNAMEANLANMEMRIRELVGRDLTPPPAESRWLEAQRAEDIAKALENVASELKGRAWMLRRASDAEYESGLV